MMSDRSLISRRQLLELLGAGGLSGLAGCGQQGENQSPTLTPTPTKLPTQTATSTSTSTQTQTPTQKQSSTKTLGRALGLPWKQLPGPPGGPVTDIAISPADPNYVYATTWTAGLYASSDGGQSWIQGPESEHHRRGIVASPHNPKRARTKQNQTDDAGRTWLGGAYRPERVPKPKTSKIFQYEYDPFDEQILYAGTGEGIYRTVDMGRSWNLVHSEFSSEENQVSSIDASPDKEGVVYAAFSEDATVVRSNDHGDSWEIISGPEDFKGPARGLAPERSGESAYVCVDNIGVVKVGDESSRKVAPDFQSPYFLFYDGPAISADDTRLYFHAYNEEKLRNDNIWGDMRLFEYDTTANETRTVETPEKHASVTAHPTDPEILYFGGWSWIWESTDRGDTWEDLSNTFVDRYLAAVGTNRTRPGTVIPGSICSTGLSVSHDGGQTFDWKRSGLEPFHEGVFNEHYVMRVAARGKHAYATTAAGLLISSDNGRSWHLLENEFSGQGNQAGGGDQRAKHLHGLAIDPEDSSVVYVGTGLGGSGKTDDYFEGSFLWKSEDGGDSWRQISSGFPTHRDTSIIDILVSKHDSSLVYVGTNGAEHMNAGGGPSGEGLGVYRSKTAGDQWQKLATPFANIHSLAQDAEDSQKLFASSSKGIYRSSDAGANWELMLPKPTKALLAHPTQGGLLFAGTEYHNSYWDLLVSRDGGETWAEGNLTIQVGTFINERDYDGIDRNADYRPDFGEIIDLGLGASDQMLYAATRGAGLWGCDINQLLN